MKPCFVISEDHINLAKTLSTGLFIFKCTLKLSHENYLAQYINDDVPCLHFLFDLCFNPIDTLSTIKWF